MQTMTGGTFQFMAVKSCNKGYVDRTHFLSTSRFKFKAWMREGNWSLWILFTDPMAIAGPTYIDDKKGWKKSDDHKFTPESNGPN